MAQPVGNVEKVRALAASARVLAVGGVRGRASSQVTLYDTSGEKVERTVDIPAHVLALAATDEAFIAACADGHVRIISKGDGSITRDIAAHIGPAGGAGSATAVAAHGDLIATAGTDGALRV